MNGWIKYENPHEIRGHRYECLMNLSTGAFIHINSAKNDSSLNLYVWCEFPGMNEHQLYYGTQVECMRIIDRLAEKFNATDLAPWD